MTKLASSRPGVLERNGINRVVERSIIRHSRRPRSGNLEFMNDKAFPPPPSKWRLRTLRPKRWAKRVASVAWGDFWSPFTDNSALYSYMGLIVATLLTVNAGGFFHLMSELSALNNLLYSLSLATLLWFLLCIIRAPFRARRQERDEGQWADNRFILREPRLVFQRQVTVEDHQKPIEFEIADAEPGGGVEFRVDVDVWSKCVAHVFPVIPGVPLMLPDTARNPTQALVAVPISRKFRVVVEKWAPSNPTVVSVNLISLYLPQ